MGFFHKIEFRINLKWTNPKTILKTIYKGMGITGEAFFVQGLKLACIIIN